MMAWILAEAWPYIAGAGAAALALLFAFMRGRSSAEQDHQVEERQAIDKAKEIRDANNSKSDDAVRADARGWVRSNKR